MSSRLPRILAIMGSGETAPTMVTPHREIVARLGDPTPRAVLLDTPYGFQENASEITQRAIEYFSHRVQLTIEPAGFLGPLAADQTQRTPIAEAAALSRLRTAGFVFAADGTQHVVFQTSDGQIYEMYNVPSGNNRGWHGNVLKATATRAKFVLAWARADVEITASCYCRTGAP